MKTGQRNAGQEGCRTCGMQDRRDAGREKCTTGMKQDMRNAQQKG